MLKSESRGSKQQIRQLCGIRGLMVKPSGNIIEMPILTSFKEGLSVLDYFNSTHGARKGLADTALKTADAGYLTRKLCNVAMDVLITHSRNYDKLGVWKSSITENGVEVISLKDRILGRYSVESIKNPSGSGYIIKSGGLITNSIIQKLNFFGIHKVRIMSPLTSVNTNNISVKSYGVDLSTGRPIKLGTAVGIIAAQSIGEPGTQLTMRTFHIGGIANKERSFNRIVSLHSGIILFKNFKALRRKSDLYYVLSSNGYISILNIYSHIQFKYSIELGFKLFVKNKSYINKGDIIAE
ncbi:hypothetical protein E5P55_00850 [Candidatus Pinguicoccus supinus]|uniref:DNA-directed RNA polymerase n=1 Tax=Candidatus Pinguicoccus supinus TaxID=2529394 RepID=A0A7T0FXT5_9BACT|nr:hypothetical protein E5P55_00850 [Candidatus Pinguicoccus supinus]